MYSTSSGARRKLIGTATAASRWHASSDSTNSIRLWRSRRDAVTRPHAAGLEHGREARRAVVKLGVRPDLLTEDERAVVRMGPARPAGELRQHQPA